MQLKENLTSDEKYYQQRAMAKEKLAALEKNIKTVFATTMDEEEQRLILIILLDYQASLLKKLIPPPDDLLLIAP